MRLSFIFDRAGENVLGKGALAMMYQAGRDAGRAPCERPGGAAGVKEALEAVLTEGEEVWQFEPWQEPGSDGLWTEENGKRLGWFVFRRCPLLSLARNAGSAQGGIICHTLHGYMAGSIENLVGTKVDIRIGHCGPRACKLMVEMRP